MTFVHISSSLEIPVSTVSMKIEKENEIIFNVKNSGIGLSIRFAKELINNQQCIQINDQVYTYEKILENPERIYTLIQQDILKDTIEKLP